jgi:hypothetical protein
MSFTFLMLAAVATEVPPNFKTCMMKILSNKVIKETGEGW